MRQTDHAEVILGSLMPRKACDKKNDNARDAKESRDQCAQKGNFDACPKKINHPENNRADDAVRNELPHDAERQRNHLAEDGKDQNGDRGSCNDIQIKSPFCFPWRVIASPHLHTPNRRPRAARGRCVSRGFPSALGALRYTLPSPPPQHWDSLR